MLLFYLPIMVDFFSVPVGLYIKNCHLIMPRGISRLPASEFLEVKMKIQFSYLKFISVHQLLTFVIL
jgi:hypothetical protein